MKKPATPNNEIQRLEALHGYAILDTAPELRYDDLTFLASQICATPIALISLVDEERQWFKSHYGLAATETPRELAFCAHAINDQEPLIVEDAHEDERFSDNPLVTGGPLVRFYAGAVLTTPNGENIGTLCVIDHRPRKLDDNQRKTLKALARQVVALLEYQKLERTLKQRENFLATILGALPSQVFYVDNRYVYHYANPSYERWFSVTAKACIGKEITEIAGNQVFTRMKPYLDLALNGEHQEFEATIPNKSGAMKIVHMIFVPDLTTDKKIDGVFAIAIDITDERASEKLAMKQQVLLVSSAKMAALGEMAAGIAHEINNPLTIIQGKIERLRKYLSSESTDAEKCKTELSAVESTAKRISKIIAGLRSFGRDSTNDPMETTNLAKIIEDTQALCRERFINHSIDLQISCDENIWLKCRPSQISQILMNLLNNAHDAAENLAKKWVVLDVLADADFVSINVTDSGKGIPHELLEKIMRPFFTTKAVGKGTGLGLSISKGIAEDHHGELYYDERCLNTRFVLKLPIHALNRPDKLPIRESK